MDGHQLKFVRKGVEDQRIFIRDPSQMCVGSLYARNTIWQRPSLMDAMDEEAWRLKGLIHAYAGKLTKRSYSRLVKSMDGMSVQSVRNLMAMHEPLVDDDKSPRVRVAEALSFLP